MGEIVSVFACSHAPQLITRPEISTEYVEKVREVQAGIKDIGSRLKRAKPDVVVIIGADHLEAFFFDNYPMILIPVCSRTGGEMAGHTYEYEIDEKLAKLLLFKLIDEDFDVSFSQKFKLYHPYYSPLRWIEEEFKSPILPIHINSNVPPLISMRRSHKLGRSIRKIVERDAPDDLRVAVIGTGGLSHFPGTPYYGKVDVEFDNRVLKLIENGKVDELLAISDEELQGSGNLELRTWVCALGAAKEGSGTVLLHVPTFHIDYSAVEFEV